MRFLQDRLLRDRVLNDQALPAQIHVRLAEDPEQVLAVIRAGLGKADGVRVWREGTGILRRFVPAADGGGDLGASKGLPPIQVRFQFNALPWEEYPLTQFEKSGRLGTELALKLRLAFASPFLPACAATIRSTM